MPARFDMPIEALSSYRGSNPRPEHFNKFWQTALEELSATPAQVEMVAADFECPTAHCFDLYFTGVGGARIHAKVVLPKQRTSAAPAVLKFHGYSGNAGDWTDLLPFAAMGWAAAALDCRGQGGRSQDCSNVTGTTWKGHIVRGLLDGPEHLLYRAIYLDTVRLAQIVMALDGVDPSRVSAMGHSQGGGLSLACAALEPRIAKVAAHCPFLCDFKRVWELDLLKDAYEELAYFFRRFDPTHSRASEFWTSLGYIDVQHLSERIQAESLFVVGLMDTVCPPSTQFAAYNRITAEKRMLIYPDFAHEVYYGASDATLQFLRWD